MHSFIRGHRRRRRDVGTRPLSLLVLLASLLLAVVTPAPPLHAAGARLEMPSQLLTHADTTDIVAQARAAYDQSNHEASRSWTETVTDAVSSTGRMLLTRTASAWETTQQQMDSTGEDGNAQSHELGAAIPRRVSSRVFVPNPSPPSPLPLVRSVVPLTPLDDLGNHFAATVLLGSGAASGYPDEAVSKSIRLVLDTGSANIILFNKTQCGGYSRNPLWACVNSDKVGFSPSFDSTNPDGAPLRQGAISWYAGMDREEIYFYADRLRVGFDLLALETVVPGTSNQKEYVMARANSGAGTNAGAGRPLLMLVSDGSMPMILPANAHNFDSSDPATTSLINQNYFDRADGVLGMALNAASSLLREYGGELALDRSGFMDLLAGGGGPEEEGEEDDDDDNAHMLFALDFGGQQMHLGGVSEEFRERIMWGSGTGAGSSSSGSGSSASGSSIASTGDGSSSSSSSTVSDTWLQTLQPYYHSFALFSPRLCGLDLFANISSSGLGPGGAWPALVDTSSACMTLPGELHTMVMSWMPIQCTLGLYDRTPRICQLTSDQLPILPTFSFRLAPRGAEMHLDLGALLFTPQGIDMNRLCITRGESMVGGPSAVNAIVFGARVLRQLYAVFDLRVPTVPRLGFAQREPARFAQGPNQVQCVSRVYCPGMLEQYAPLNTCVPPPCGDYYFFDYDDASKRCVLNHAFHILTGTLIGAFIVLEFALNEVVMYLTKTVTSTGVVYGQ